VGVLALAEMPSLEWLELPEFGEITDAAIEALAGAPKLSNLRLSNLQSSLMLASLPYVQPRTSASSE
jgi:hypothetical protein